MHDVSELVQTLKQKGVCLWVENGQIRYKASKGTLLPEDLGKLRRLKRDIIDFLEKDCAEIPQLARRSNSDIVPLTFQQQWLWNKIHQQERRARMAAALRIFGKLNVEILKASLDVICLRHEALRTRIVTVDGIPQQHIDEAFKCNLETRSLSDGINEDTEESARQLCREFFDQPTHFEIGPLFNVQLLCLADSESILAMSMDPMIADNVSLNIFIQELWYIYTELLQGLSTSLPPVSIQYGDYAEWQCKTNESWKRIHAPYWNERLAEAERVKLPTDENLIDPTPFSAAPVHIQIEKSTTLELRMLARREGTTVAMIVLAIYVAWLSRLCSTKDLVVPFNSMGRHHSKLGNTIGYFPHALYLRIALSNNDTFLDVVRHVTTEVVRAHEHDDFGQMVVEKPELLLGTWFQWEPGGPSHDNDEPLTRSPTSNDDVFWIKNESGHDVLRIKPFRLPPNTDTHSRFELDIAFSFADRPDGIIGNGSYRADLFTARTMDSFVRNFVFLAKTFSENARIIIDTIAL